MYWRTVACCSGVSSTAFSGSAPCCRAASCCSVSARRCLSWSSFCRKLVSASRCRRSTTTNGRLNRPRERTLISASVPDRLSSALTTSAPLSAQGCGTRWPKKSCTWTHMRSLSRSVSATTMTLMLRASFRPSRCPSMPSAKALFAGPWIRAARVCRRPLGRSSRIRSPGSRSRPKRETSNGIAWAELCSKGVKLVLAPGSLSRMPGVARVRLSRPAVAMSSWSSASRGKLSQAGCRAGRWSRPRLMDIA